MPFYLDWAGLDYAKMFALEAFFVCSVFALEIPTGVVADRFGRKFSLALGGAFSGTAFALFGLTRAYPVFIFAEFVCAVGFSLFSGADRALSLGRSAWVAMPAAFLIVGFKHLRAPLLSDLMNAEIASAHRATVLSGISMLERALIMAFYPLLGFLADRSLTWTFLLLGAATVAFAAFGKRTLGDAARGGASPAA